MCGPELSERAFQISFEAEPNQCIEISSTRLTRLVAKSPSADHDERGVDDLGCDAGSHMMKVTACGGQEILAVQVPTPLRARRAVVKIGK